MCGLCGAFGVEHHWSTGSGGAQSADVPARRIERARRVSRLNAVLAGSGVVVREWRGSGYLVSGLTGRADVASDLAGIWRCVEAIRGIAFDPLALPSADPASAQPAAREPSDR